MTKLLFLLLTIVVTIVAVSSSIIGDLLQVPLFEVGKLWMAATGDVGHLITSVFTTSPDLYSYGTYVKAVAVVVILYLLHQIFWASSNRVKLFGSIGYVPEGQMSMKEMANLVRQYRQIGDLPPVYPNGWFSIMESRDLDKGQVKQSNCLGLTLAVFRGEDGTSHALDAYCPHLGANLAVGGRVLGNCVQCPFHGWQFRGDNGRCVTIPYYSGKIPDVAKVKSYTTLEINGFIYLWYHAEGIEPTWTPPEIKEISTNEWCYGGRTEHIINCHIEEISENGADISHLPQVHGPFMTSGTDLRFTWSPFWEFAKHIWDASWNQHTEPGEEHIGSLTLQHSAKLFGIHVPMMDFNVKASQIGPGIVYLYFEGFSGKGAYIHHVTPIEPMMQKVIHHVSLPWYLPSIIGKFYMYSEAVQIERDVMIWNNKKYSSKPVMVKSKEDALLVKHRRWYSQFYSENSPKMTFQKDTLDF